jgi:RimJ/RimL family protein N-acetyltransferase
MAAGEPAVHEQIACGRSPRIGPAPSSPSRWQGWTVPDPGDRIALRDVDEPTLAALLREAVDDAEPDEACPRLIDEPPGWTGARREVFLAYHRGARPDTGGTERTWAIVVDGAVAGAGRLKAVRGEAGALEAGVWLGRRNRGMGVGTQALALLAERARGAGANVLVARTTTRNAAALGALRAVKATLSLADAGDQITARLPLDQ